MNSDRNLTDADVEAVASMVVNKLENRFLLNVGKGVMKYVWAGVLGILIYLAATGYKGH